MIRVDSCRNSWTLTLVCAWLTIEIIFAYASFDSSNFLHVLLIFYFPGLFHTSLRSFSLMAISKPSLSCGAEFCDPPMFPSNVTRGSTSPVWMHYVLTCVVAIARLRCMIGTRFCMILTFVRGSSVGSTVVDVACLSRNASVSKLMI